MKERGDQADVLPVVMRRNELLHDPGAKAQPPIQVPNPHVRNERLMVQSEQTCAQQACCAGCQCFKIGDDQVAAMRFHFPGNAADISGEMIKIRCGADKALEVGDVLSDIAKVQPRNLFDYDSRLPLKILIQKRVRVTPGVHEKRVLLDQLLYHGDRASRMSSAFTTNTISYSRHKILLASK